METPQCSREQEKSRLAVWAMWLGVLSIPFVPACRILIIFLGSVTPLHARTVHHLFAYAPLSLAAVSAALGFASLWVIRPGRGRLGGYGPALTGMVVGPGLALLFSFTNFSLVEIPLIWEVKHVQADMRTLATALESYRIDHGTYPASSARPEENCFGELSGKYPALAQQPTFMRPRQSVPATLMAPRAYLSQYPEDPYAPAIKTTYAYYSVNDPKNPDRSGWIVWSPGPDEKYDLTMKNIKEAFDPKRTRKPTTFLLERRYDPTNGNISSGDIWRVKQ